MPTWKSPPAERAVWPNAWCPIGGKVICLVVLACLLVVGGPFTGGASGGAPKAAAAGTEIFRLIRYVLPGKVRFLVVIAAGNLRYTSFGLTHPDRLVVDLFGVGVPALLAVSPQGGAPVDTRTPISFAGDPVVRALRLGQQGDRTRLAFDLRGPTYSSVILANPGALLIDLLTANTREVVRPTPVQVVTSALLEQGTIVQRAEFGVWPVLVSGGGSSRQAVVEVGYASGKRARYMLHRDALAGNQWVIDRVTTT